jgi:hypothetical protein
MPTQYIVRRTTIGPGASSKDTAAPIYVDSDDSILKMITTGAGSTTEVQIIDATSAQTLTNKTISGGTFSATTATSGFNLGAAVASVQTATTEGTVLTNYGLSTIVSSTSPTAKTYTIAAPIAGAYKTIINVNASSTGTATVTTAATTRFLNPAGTIMTFTTGLGSIDLYGVTSSSWAIVSHTTDVTLS